MQTLNLESLTSELTETQSQKLSIILSRVDKGSNKVIITPVAERVGPETLISEWNEIFKQNQHRMNKPLLEMEEAQESKYGPRSIAKPWPEIREQALESYNTASNRCDHLSSDALKSRDKGKLRPLDLANAVKKLKLSTNAGLPTLQQKSTALEDTLADFDNQYEMDWPMVPFIRTQENEKTRLVKGYPLVDVMQESRFFHPLFDYYRNMQCYAAMIGPEEVNKAMTHLISEAVRLGFKCVSGDISAFDDSVGVPLQTKGFDEMKYLLQDKYHDEFDVIAQRFGFKHLVVPNQIWTGEHGIPSGSHFTGLLGSVVNRKVADVPIELSQFLGDDFAAVVENVDELFTKYSNCGLELNTDKTLVSDNYFIFLQNLFHPDYMVDGEIKGIYPTKRALNRLIYPERFSEFHKFDLDGKSYFAIRSLSILENCKYHPLFEIFVKFWLKYEKYAIPNSQSISQYVKYLNATTGTLGTTNQHGENVAGLSNFASYKLAVQFG